MTEAAITSVTTARTINPGFGMLALIAAKNSSAIVAMTGFHRILAIEIQPKSIPAIVGERFPYDSNDHCTIFSSDYTNPSDHTYTGLK